MGETNGEIRYSVLVPLLDTRGDAAEHLRTWTHGQTLPRERFQVVVASSGRSPADEEEVRALLAPQDVLARAGTDDPVGLWNAAAARASAPWLVLTEAHCLADADCLAALDRAVRANPELEAFTFGLGHVVENDAGRLLSGWFEEMFARWDASDWRRLSFAGCAVRRDAFEAVGSLDASYGLFSAPMLSAQMHERGRVGHAPDARVGHVHSETLHEHDEHTVNYVRGELEARGELPAEFCERYFGHASVWSNRLRYQPALARRVVRALGTEAALAARGRRADAAWLARELAAWLPAALAGAAPAVAWARLRHVANTYAAEHLPVLDRFRQTRVLRAHEDVVHLTRLEWVREREEPELPAPGLSCAGRLSAEALDPGTLVGAHGLDPGEEGWFRWTEPVAVLRVAPPAGDHVLTVDTGGLRGAPLSYFQAAYLGARRVPADALAEDGERLTIRIADEWRDAVRSNGITLVCRPFLPSRNGSSDPRRLGIPVRSVELAPVA